MHGWRQQTSESQWLPALSAWFDSPVGRQLLAEESTLLEEAATECGGPYLLEMGVTPQRQWSPGRLVRRHFRLGSAVQNDVLETPLDGICELDQLPVESASQDMVILHHLLEFVPDPHQLLREVERVVIPHGHVVIAIFNPYSLMGLRMLAGRLREGSRWQNHLFGPHRVRDWLRLLGFEVEHTAHVFHRIPVERPKWFMKHHPVLPGTWGRSIPFGGAYLLFAVKYRAPLTPSRMKWESQPLVGTRPLGAARKLHQKEEVV